MRKKIIPLIILIALGTMVYYLYLKPKPESNDRLRVSGNFEITEVQLSFKIPGRVASRLVSEGDPVKPGQTVATLDNDELLQEANVRRSEVRTHQSLLAELEAGSRPEEISQAEARVRSSQARLAELKAGSRQQEIATIEAQCQRDQADYDRFQTDYERQTTLFKTDVISAREYDQAKTSRDMANARLKETKERLDLAKTGNRPEQIEAAEAALTEAQQRYELVKKGPRLETIDQARSRLRQSREVLALAETRLNYTSLISNCTGVVLSTNIEPGEYTTPGTPIVTVGDLENVWLRAYIDERDLGRIKLGQNVRITTDTFKDKVYEGTISYISPQAEFTPKNVQTEKERVKLVYRIKIMVNNGNHELKPGMPADGEIGVSSE